MAFPQSNKIAYRISVLIFVASIVHRGLMQIAVFRPGEELTPTITITGSPLRFLTIDGTVLRSTSIRCDAPLYHEELKLTDIRIERERDNVPVKVKEMCAIATETDQTGSLAPLLGVNPQYSVTGSISANPNVPSSLSFVLKQNAATCGDAGLYYCQTTTTDSKGPPKVKTVTSRVRIAPLEFSVTRLPAKVPIKAGLQLSLQCTAIVGTVQFGSVPKKSQLTWVYRNRQSSVDNVYNELEGNLQKAMKVTAREKVTCSERQTVVLNMTVDESRDSLRDYFCVVANFLTDDGLPVYEGGGHSNVSMPSFEVVVEKGIGIAGFVGIGLGGVALLVSIAFAIAWGMRRKQKRSARKKEVAERKSNIENRRRSIVEIMEQRQSQMNLPASTAASTEDTTLQEESSAA